MSDSLISIKFWFVPIHKWVVSVTGWMDDNSSTFQKQKYLESV